MKPTYAPGSPSPGFLVRELSPERRAVGACLPSLLPNAVWPGVPTQQLTIDVYILILITCSSSSLRRRRTRPRVLPVDATGEPPGRSEASRTNLPECQQPPVKACSKDAPDPQPMRGYRYMWRPHLFCLRSRLDARWQEAWHRHDNKSCERCSSRASSPHLFSRSDDTAVA